MKVLWFSTCRLTVDDMAGSGTWLKTMSEILTYSGVDLINVTTGSSEEVIFEDLAPNFKQYLLPVYHLFNGLPSPTNIADIVKIVDENNPDIIQIWGMESWFGLLSARGYLKQPVILEIQGIIWKCAEVYYGGLNFWTFAKNIKPGLLRYVRRFSPFIKLRYTIWGRREREMLRRNKIISVQSEWVRESISPYLTESTKILSTGICVREPFFEAPKWEPHFTDEIVVFSVTSTLIPYKGIHDAIKAFILIKEKYPKAIFQIAGNINFDSTKVSNPDYLLYIRKLIKENSLEDSIRFVGALNAQELAAKMASADVVIHPSYVESYSMALAESMAVGVPSVVSSAGAMLELAEDGVSALFYKTGDYQTCAAQANRIVSDKAMARKLSEASRKQARERNSFAVVKEIQLMNLKNL